MGMPACSWWGNDLRIWLCDEKNHWRSSVPDKIYCPQGDVTNLLEIDYSLYTAVFIEYSIYNSGGDQFRAGRFVAAFKSTGTPEYRDYPEVVYSGTTTGADFIIGYGGTYPVIQLDNQGGDDYFLRFTSRLLMR